jgi:hypothetical protein
MGLIQTMFGKKETSQVIKGPQPTFAAPTLIYVPPVVIKPGKWIVWHNVVGIIAAIRDYPNVEFHVVDEEGITTDTVIINMNEARIAKYLEIPACRRPEDYAWAASFLGYV